MIIIEKNEVLNEAFIHVVGFLYDAFQYWVMCIGTIE